MEDRRPEKWDPFSLLPQGVLPTDFQVLIQSDDLLYIRRMGSPSRRCTPVQLRLIEQLVLNGAGSVTVVCIWQQREVRELEVYSYIFHDESIVHIDRLTTDQDGVRTWVSEWFYGRGR